MEDKWGTQGGCVTTRTPASAFEEDELEVEGNA